MLPHYYNHECPAPDSRMVPFERFGAVSYSPSIVTIWLYLASLPRYIELLVENRDFFIQPVAVDVPLGGFWCVSINPKNNSQCRFFTVYEVQLILMYYLYVSCVFSMYFIFRF